MCGQDNELRAEHCLAHQTSVIRQTITTRQLGFQMHPLGFYLFVIVNVAAKHSTVTQSHHRRSGSIMGIECACPMLYNKWIALSALQMMCVCVCRVGSPIVAIVRSHNFHFSKWIWRRKLICPCDGKLRHADRHDHQCCWSSLLWTRSRVNRPIQI